MKFILMRLMILLVFTGIMTDARSQDELTLVKGNKEVRLDVKKITRIMLQGHKTCFTVMEMRGNMIKCLTIKKTDSLGRTAIDTILFSAAEVVQVDYTLNRKTLHRILFLGGFAVTLASVILAVNRFNNQHDALGYVYIGTGLAGYASMVLGFGERLNRKTYRIGAGSWQIIN